MHYNIQEVDWKKDPLEWFQITIKMYIFLVYTVLDPHGPNITTSLLHDAKCYFNEHKS